MNSDIPPTYEGLLRQCGLPPLPFLGKGMQCLVFAEGNERVVKLYSQAAGIENLQRLMRFYASLDTSVVSFALPQIIAVESIKEHILVKEKRMRGISPTLDYLQHLTTHELEIYFQHYVDCLFQIQEITTSFLQPGEPLDLSGDFCHYSQYGSWQSLLTSNLKWKLSMSGGQYCSFVSDLESLAQAVYAKIPSLPNNVNRLIHGDFYPANTLMDNDFNITAVLDFGTYTLVGDPTYDIALGWIFADMYQNVKQLQAKDFVGELIHERISEEEWQRIKLYILIYSLLSADIYSDPDAPDGHFLWAMNNLKNEDFREVL